MLMQVFIDKFLRKTDRRKTSGSNHKKQKMMVDGLYSNETNSRRE